MRNRFFIFFLTIWCIAHLPAQGTLQFNRVLLLDHSQSPYTVPAGKVWKVEQLVSSVGSFVSAFNPSYSNVTWSTGGANPCTGAVSGTTNTAYIGYTTCRPLNPVLVNGYRYNFNNQAPVWLPAATVLTVPATACADQVNVSLSNLPYYHSQIGSYLCGPVNITAGTPVPNSYTISIIEFNILP